MDAEDKAKIDRILALAEDNNAYIRQVRRSQKTSQMLKAIYWVVIAVVALGGYYFVKPYVSSMTSLFGGSGASFQMSDVERLENLFGKGAASPATGTQR